MKKRTIIEIALTVIVFGLLLIITSGINPSSYIGITGNVVAESIDEVQATVQEILRNPVLSSLADGTRFCTNVMNGEEVYSFKIRKSGNLFNIEQSGRDCDGKSVEDFIVTFLKYDYILELKDNFNINFFKNDLAGEKYWMWGSKYVLDGGLVVCDEYFKQTYCPFIKKQTTKSERQQYGITCCDDPDSESAGMLSGGILNFVKTYWWLFGILGICIILGGGAAILLSNKDDKEEIKPSEQIVDYIISSRKAGYGDFQIKDALLKNGWDQTTIDASFEEIRKKHLSSFDERFEKWNMKE
jgi:hypothetical protein